MSQEAFFVCPDYCDVCGNLDFRFDAIAHRFVCAWCCPAMLRRVQFPSAAFVETARSGNKATAPVPVGDAMPTKPEGFFTWEQTRGAWPRGWRPPRPEGPALQVFKEMGWRVPQPTKDATE